MRRFSLVSLLAVAGLLATSASPAGAAVTIGAAFPGATGTCPQGETGLQSSSPGSPPQYAAPFEGVITSWSFHATPIPPTLLELKVGRPAGGNVFTIIGESPPKAPPGGVLSTYTDVRISVHAGDVIGFYGEGPDEAECFRTPAPGYESLFAPGDQAPGSAPAGFAPIDVTAQMSVSAILQPDCDKDGRGDETEDKDTSSCVCRGAQATIVGTKGNDELSGTPGRDVIAGLGGNDNLSGLGGTDVICGAKGDDTLRGGQGNDTLLGQKGNDNLLGNQGKDKLSGKKGNDRLKGAGGNDKLKGGQGSDTCIGGKANDSASKCEVEKSL